MNFSPKTEDELRSAMLAPEGEYDFEVLEASDAISKKSGNPMIKLSVGIYRGDAIGNRIFDYLLPSLESKLRHFCDTVGLLDKYEAGTLCAYDCRGRSGKCRVVIDDKDANFPPKNAIKDYVVRKAKPLQSKPLQTPGSPIPAEDQESDDVPF